MFVLQKQQNVFFFNFQFSINDLQGEFEGFKHELNQTVLLEHFLLESAVLHL